MGFGLWFGRGGLKPTVQVNLPAMRTKAFVDSTYYYYNNLVGPDRRIDGDVPTCYAHSSEGAILAAANFEVMRGAGKKRLSWSKRLPMKTMLNKQF